ncbi:MAG: hypothetical protein IJE77_03865 [Thermoguttaceae bacterium]|nr:hypothetical protein [Thermoguttaceae bacterium]
MKRQGKSKNATDSNRPDAPKLALDSAEYRAALNVAAELLEVCDKLALEERDEERKVAGRCFHLACQAVGAQFNKPLYLETVDLPKYAAAHVAPGLFDAGVAVELDAREIVGYPFKSPLVSPTEERQ